MTSKRRRKGTGSLFLRPGSPYIQLKIVLNNKVHKESTKTRDWNEAERILRERLGQLDHGILPGSRNVKFSDLARDMEDDYMLKKHKSLKDLQSRMKRHILPHFGGRKAVEITGADVVEYVRMRQSQKASNGEINRELNHINRAFKLGLMHDKVYRKPSFELLPEPKHRRGTYWRDEEVAVLLKHLPTNIQPLILFMYYTGWRVSEVQSLRWHNVNFEFRQIQLDPGSTKNARGEERIFPFIPGLEELLLGQHKHTRELEVKIGKGIPWVFHRNGKEIRYFTRDWYRAVKTCNFVGKKRHDFRSTAARNLLKLGFQELEVLTMVGWKSLYMLQYYCIIDSRDLHERADRLRRRSPEEGPQNREVKDSAEVQKDICLSLSRLWRKDIEEHEK